MPRPSSLRAAPARRGATPAALVTLLLTGLLALAGLAVTPAVAATEDAASDPLLVHIDAISPVVPRSGTVDISGTVTNTTDADYTRVNLHAFASASPIIDAPSLAASSTIAPELYVGERITEPGTFDTVEVLPPGSTEAFELSIPVEQLGISGEPGVYWIGVHALGDSVEPRHLSGRARTFIPVLPQGRKEIEAAILLPLRSGIRYAPDGSLAGVNRWTKTLAPGGRLHTLLDVAEAGAGTDFTWLVDPAVLDAISRLAVGNPPRTMAPDPTVPGQEPPPDADPATPPVPLAPTAAPDANLDAEEQELATAATQWLTRFAASTSDRPVLALPFGDLDVSAAMRHDAPRFEQARARSNEVFAALGLQAVPTLVPENDVVTTEALVAAPPETVVLLGDTAFAAPPDTPHGQVRMLGHKILVTSSGAQAGGPGPTEADDPLAMRQRVLSEASLRLQQGSRAPIVMTLPSGWHPEDAADLFSAFDQGWLSAVSVPEILERPAVGASPGSLAYTEADERGELLPANFAAARRLTDVASVAEQVLTMQTTIEAQVLDEALVGLSQRQRPQRREAMQAANAAHDEIADALASVEVEVPPSITLSSSSGTIGVPLVNGLDQPVTVVVDAQSEAGLELVGPGVRQLAAGSRSQVRFQATAHRPGVHDVRFRVTSEDGTALGSEAELPLRATEVSFIIWIAMAAGAGLLFSAIGLRLWRQIRARRREREAA